ncbi:MAG: Hsp20/alpha crystallin family protein [Pikeienuella sp.]
MNKKGQGPRGKAALEEIERRFGALGGALGAALSEIAAAAKDGQADRDAAAQTFEISLGPARVVSSVRTSDIGSAAGSAGVSRGPTAGAEQSAPQPPSTQDEPATLEVETIVEDGVWVAVCQRPGLAAEMVSIAVDAATLEIKIAGPAPACIEVPLPNGLDPGSLSHWVTNGVLEIRGQISVSEGEG